jgi:hypothetical protein
MKGRIAIVLLFLIGLVLVAGSASGKNTGGRLGQYTFTEMPQPPSNPPEIGGSIFQSAAATTTLLAWYQFDNLTGGCNEQGWTKHDMTTQIATYFHVAGSAIGCDAITPIAGTKSMWCGQWPTTADPWCGWGSLPGYGNNWDQSLEAQHVSTLTYSIVWDTEPGYDFVYLEWWDPLYYPTWVKDATVNGGQGSYDDSGSRSESVTSPYGSTKVRIHVVSDGAWSDEDGQWPTVQGAVTVDGLSINGGAAEDWEGEACNAMQSTDGKWVATIPPGYGIYAHLVPAAGVVQEDPCVRILGCVWAFFDDPAVTNYTCGGWPLQGAMPYGPDANGLYMNNEVWSPWIPNSGSGSTFLLQFLAYRDLPLDNLQFYTWHVHTRDAATGNCPTQWRTSDFVWYGGGKDWARITHDISSYVAAGDDEIQISMGAVDMCGVWCGTMGSGACHSHAPLIDQVKLSRVDVVGPQWTVRNIDLWQDNFPEEGLVEDPDGAGPLNAYARCDMAQSITPSNKKGILPGDSLKVYVTDPAGLADDATGGRARKAVYAFVKVTDRFGTPIPGVNGLAIQSPDNKAYATDPSVGQLRWPLVAGLAPAGWDAYRMDYAYTAGGGRVKDTFCADLMDLGSGPTGPHYKHANENVAANVGIFAPGDVIHYILAAKNTAGQWSYITRNYNGQGGQFRTSNLAVATSSPMEWSVLPDAGRLAGDAGDILLVDDADDRGGPAQLYFDFAFKILNVENRVDRFDVLGPSSGVGNSLASRVKNIQNQMIGDPIEVYQKVLWNCSDLSSALMGDGGSPNGGSSAEKSNDFALCNFFLTNHFDNPGWAYWGDDVVTDWSTLVGADAVAVQNVFMNHALIPGNQSTVTGVVSPRVASMPFSPWTPETFYVNGGCPLINDFDMPGAAGASLVSHLYAAAANAPAAVYQATPNASATTARFFLAGFGYNFIRDDDTDHVPDYVTHLRKTLVWFENALDEPIGIDPLAFSNRLENAYPNPFNPTTTIRYSIASAGHVSLKIYNAAGQLVRTLVDEAQAPRVEGFSIPWDGANDSGQSVASGVYFYKLATNGFSETKKLVLLK